MTSGGITKRTVLSYCSGAFFVASIVLGIQYAVNGEPLAIALAMLAFAFGAIMALAFWAAGLPKRQPSGVEDDWSSAIR